MTTTTLQQRNISGGIQRVTRAQQYTDRVATKRYARPSQRATHSNAIAMVDNHRNILATGIMGLFCMSVCMYLYMLVTIVVATVDRRSIEEQVRNQSTELSAIESDYGQAIGSLTLGEVKNLGYVDAGEATFAVRDTVPTFTLRNE